MPSADPPIGFGGAETAARGGLGNCLRRSGTSPQGSPSATAGLSTESCAASPASGPSTGRRRGTREAGDASGGISRESQFIAFSINTRCVCQSRCSAEGIRGERSQPMLPRGCSLACGNFHRFRSSGAWWALVRDGPTTGPIVGDRMPDTGIHPVGGGRAARGIPRASVTVHALRPAAHAQELLWPGGDPRPIMIRQSS